jgi:uncharacterized protein (DUF1330 family)
MTTYERLTPTDTQLSALAQGGSEDPVVMVNLLRFRARAAYPRDFEGEKPETGEEAFRRYVETATPCLTSVGGRILWGAPAWMTLVGPPNERWDEILVVAYPSRATFLKLQEDADYAATLVHRQAALAETRVFACGTG